MLQEISYLLIFGKPLIMYLGILTLALILGTAAVPVLNQAGLLKIGYVWHPRLARIALAFALVHGLLGALAYL